jgi:hypothetical protein
MRQFKNIKVTLASTKVQPKKTIKMEFLGTIYVPKKSDQGRGRKCKELLLASW